MQRIRSHLKHGESSSATSRQAMEGLLGVLGFDPKLFAVFEIWDRETKGLIRGCEAVAIQGTKIWVRVPSTVHRHELLYSKDHILKRVNQAMGRKAITDILFELDATMTTAGNPSTEIKRSSGVSAALYRGNQTIKD